jgi:hypothetical protein
MDKEEIKTGLRMYFFVPYNIMPIQQGIQAGHCAEQYALKYNISSQWLEYVQNHKTWVILNGGTTNNSEDLEQRGSLNSIKDTLENEEILYASFYEPDLNDALSAICFLADEKVYDMENYPMYDEWCYQKKEAKVGAKKGVRLAVHITFPEEPTDAYIEFVGGPKNLALKELIYRKRLA